MWAFLFTQKSLNQLSYPDLPFKDLGGGNYFHFPSAFLALTFLTWSLFWALKAGLLEPRLSLTVHVEEVIQRMHCK